MTLYGTLVLLSATYLLWGFKIQLRSLLKAALALQIVGDLIFLRLLEELPVLRFIKNVTLDHRFTALAILMGCVGMMDLGACLVRNPSRHIAPYAPLRFNPRLAKRIGYALVFFAAAAKLVAMAASGVFSGPSVIHAVLTWQPEDLVGLAYLDVASLLLFPIGAALVTMARPRRPHMKALIAIMAFSVLSPWKADSIKMVVMYGLAVSHFGLKELRPIFWSKKALAAIAAIVFLFSLKAQYRYTGEASTDPEALASGFLTTISSRFMGGNFQTMSYVIGSVEGGAPLMGGEYNSQTLYMWIPRFLWQDKPRFAAEQIYDYLDFVPGIDEAYGTSSFSISVFGTFFLDFGMWLGLACSFVLGIVLSFGDRMVLRMRQRFGNLSGIKYVVLSTIWLNSVYALAEAGLPAMIPTLLCGIAMFYLVLVALHVVGLNPPRLYTSKCRLPQRQLPQPHH